MERVCSNEGISLCPETAACMTALEILREKDWVRPHDRVVVFNTGAAQKYVEAMACDLPKIDLSQPLNWERIENGGH